MYMKWYRAALVVLICGSLVGCNEQMMSEIDRVKDSKQEITTQHNENEEKKQEMMESYKEMEKAPEEVVANMDKESLHVLNKMETPILLENTTDETEFARSIAAAMFNFFTFKWSPEEYYSFLNVHGSRYYRNDVLAKEEEAILLFKNVQGLLKDRTEHIPEEYEITEVILNKGKSSGYFYRKDTTRNGAEAYYIISIKKEDGYWRLEGDRPSPPYEKIEDKIGVDKDSEEDSNARNDE